ncbi:MAG: copper-translocating P-type ATPase [Pyrinomonadaceae bacterium]|nr:copper-translocating P-type ATPase [Sphingobacteriaceae bacterium]
MINSDTIKERFPITGLSCASCAISAESILQSQDGVVTANVSFANNTASIEYSPGLIKPEALKSAVQSVGYDLIIENSTSAKASFETIKVLKFKTLERNTWLSILSSIPIVAMGMFFMHAPYSNYIQWALATPVVFIFGSQFYINAWKQAKHKSATMDTLVALSTGIAYLFSVFNTVYPQFWIRRGLEAHVYFEAASVVIAFILLGKLLEESAKSNTSEAIKKLMGLQPKTVIRITKEIEDIVPVEQIRIRDILLVKPGEKIPLDGKVLTGSSYVDESMITGEPIPVIKEKDATVFAGTINQKGSFRFMAEKVGKDTLLAQIIKLVQEAQGSKAPVQKLVDKISGVFVPVVIAAACFSLFAWIVLGGQNGFTQGLLAMVTVLVIACPCALGLATPTAIIAGVGKGAENGILIKDAESLEEAKNITALVLDKTGTITEGKPEVLNIIWKDGVDSNELSKLIYSLELQSEHPLGDAVVRYLKSQKVEKVAIDSFESLTGEGVFATHKGDAFFLGSPKLMSSNAIKIDEALHQQSEEWLFQAYTVIWFSDRENALAVIAIADKLKSTSTEAVKALQDMNIEVYMLTGDNETTAAAVAKQVGIRHFKAESMPADKAEFIKQLQQKGEKVAMVGDGINDSQALAQANVSIAMGKGTDIAMDVAQMTLISSNLMQIPKAIRLSRATVKVIRQNLFWAFIYNIIGIPLAAGILYPFTGFLLNPMFAGAAMALSSISVVSNSLRLKYLKLS